MASLLGGSHGSLRISRTSTFFFKSFTQKKTILVLLVTIVGLSIGGYRVFDWYLKRAIVSSIFASLAETAQNQRDLLSAYFKCGAGPQDTGSEIGSRVELLQTTFGDDGINFLTNSEWTVVEEGKKNIATVHFSVGWFDINHVTLDENVLYFYCRDCTRQIQGDINSILNKDTDVPGRLKMPVMTYTFCDADTARDAASIIDAVTRRSLSKFIYEDGKDPVEASTIDP
jgi:hypothetical protein